jgi:esterase/lipase superfamily enzyme
MPSSGNVLVALLEAAEELASALGDAWPPWRDRLLLLLSQLDAEGLSDALDDKVWTLVEELSDQTAARPIVAVIMEKETAQRQTQSVSSVRSIRGTAPFQAPLSTYETSGPNGVVVLTVFYGTDRAQQARSDATPDYTASRGVGLQLGVATVSIPPRHRIGRLEGPRLWRFELRPDPTEHVALLSLAEQEPDSFAAQLSSSLATADDRDVLVFVHGYNVDFTAAVRRAAQIAFDLKFAGCASVFSWPSTGNLLGYLTDGGNAEWAFDHFREYLNFLLTRVNARFVHVIAHSMGCRLLLNAMDRFDPVALPDGSARLGQVVFAAPDVDADTLARTARTLTGRAAGITIYLSGNDLALNVSRRIFGHGRAGGELFVVDGIDTIDASQADTSLIGLRHSYYGSKRSILSDLCSLINSSLRPSRRFDVDAATHATGPYWVYRS